MDIGFFINKDGSNWNGKFTNNDYDDGRWHYAAATLSGGPGGTITIYIDGVAVAQTDDDLGTVDTYASAFQIFIGTKGALDDYCWGGSLDDVRIWNRALSAVEIKRLYDSTQSKVNSSQTDVLTKGLVGYWTFDGADIGLSGTRAKDSSGNNNHGTITGAVPKAGKIGQALSFDGCSGCAADDQVNLSSPASMDNLQAKTISAWIYPKSFGEDSFGTVVQSGSNNSRYYVQLCNNDGAECNVASTFVFHNQDAGGVNENEWYAPVNTIKFNQWQHVAITYVCGDTNALLYYNGQQVTAVKSRTALASCYDDSSEERYIGSATVSQQATFDGLIDDVRIYNRALSASEVQVLYNMGR